MTRILKAFGEQESPNPHSPHWNLCKKGEIVGSHLRICESDEARCICGCGISFVGIDTEERTTRGIVSEIPLLDLTRILEKFYQRQFLRGGANERRYCEIHMEWLRNELWRYPIGQVLLIEKKPIMRLIPTNPK